MLVCIPKNVVVPNYSMQKNLNINEILGDVRFFDTNEKADENNYLPISVCVSIRSTYSNLVVAHKIDKIERYYTTITNIPNPLPFKGDELLAYLTSLAVTQAYSPTNPIVQKLMVTSALLPIGVYHMNMNMKVAYPYFYSQVIINDEYLDLMRDNLNDGYYLVPISEMNTNGNLKKITDELIIIKEKSNA